MDMRNPVDRCFVREFSRADSLLKTVRKDLHSVVQVCEGEIKQTNYLRAVISDLSKGMVPNSWKKFIVPDAVSVAAWLVDYSQRIAQFQKIVDEQEDAVKNKRKGGTDQLNVWLGALFSAEALLTATRQAAARKQGRSIEDLELELVIGNPGEELEPDDNSFIVTGLTLEAGSWKKGALVISPDLITPLPSTRFLWTPRRKELKNEVTLPVYLNTTRLNLLFSVRVMGPPGVPDAVWPQRGAALTLWQPQ